MEWNVYVYDINAKQLETYNIFKHPAFFKDCQKALKEFGDDKEKFIEKIRNEIMYYFWSKCEWEIMVFDNPPHPNYPGKRIDVSDQVKMNWDIFVEYVWEHRNELKKARRG